MTNFKTILLAATAMTMVAGGAYANENKAYLYQGDFAGAGSENVAVIDQTGGNNNEAGDSANNLLQNGDENLLKIEQTGSGNKIGVSAAGTELHGVEQHGFRNELTISQTNTGNRVQDVLQFATPRTRGLQDGASNTVDISQTGTNQSVQSVRQEKTLDGTDNVATISQSNLGNVVSRLSQTGAGNNASTQQVGASGNISIGQQGTDNGVGSFRFGAAGIVANPFGRADPMQQGVAYQEGTNNSLTYDVVRATSSGNLFSFRQGGNGNSLTGIQFGSDNEIAVRQEGLFVPGFPFAAEDNVASFSQSGVDNSTGIFQSGSSNETTVDVSGSDNDAGTIQIGFGSGNDATLTIDGNLNIVAAAQVGAGNNARISVEGNRNRVGALQVGQNHGSALTIDGNRNFVVTAQGNLGGSGNTATVAVTGNGNNQLEGVRPAAFTNSEAALAVNTIGSIGAGITSLGGREVASLLPDELRGQSVLTPGVVAQWGGNNTAEINVNGNENLFSTLQVGAGNSIDATITGNSNQFVAFQIGAGEQATVTQNGSFNTAVIKQ